MANQEITQRNRKPIVGVVGGIGSGKSLAAALIAGQAGRVINADALGHEALEQPQERQQVIGRWGEAVLGPDGKIDRRKLGKIVFADLTELRALEKIVFPWIGRQIQEEIERANRDPAARLIVIDAAIMLEAGWGPCDRIVFIDVPREQRLARLNAQRGWTEAELAAREKAQWSIEEKRRRAHDVIVNTGDREELARQIEMWRAQCGLG